MVADLQAEASLRRACWDWFLPAAAGGVIYSLFRLLIGGVAITGGVRAGSGFLQWTRVSASPENVGIVGP